MPTKSTFISDDLFGFEIHYTVEKIPSQIEECHGMHEMGLGYEIELESVNMVVNNEIVKFHKTPPIEDVNILHSLTDSQKDEIIKRIHAEIID